MKDNSRTIFANFYLASRKLFLRCVSKRLPLPYAEQMFLSTNQQLPVTDCRRSESLFANLILRDPLEFRPRLHHVHHAVVVEKINQVIGRQERRVVCAHA